MRPTIGFTIVAIAVLAALLLAACEGAPTATPTATPAPTPTATATTVPTPTPTAVPSATPTIPLPTPRPTSTTYVHVEPNDPCGPSQQGYYGPLHEGFLHWNEDGSYLVFDQGDTLWTLGIVDGSMRKLIDTDPDADYDPRSPEYRDALYGFYADVSPDGFQIVYSSCEFLLYMPRGSQYTEGYELVMINVDGTGKTRLTDNHYLDHYPVWSPDGRHIVLVRYERFERLGVSFYPDNPDDRIEVRLAIRSSDGTEMLLLPTNNVALYPPAWSPDGQTIAYISDEGEWDPELVVWTIGLDDAEPVRIGSAISPPTWSPDGEELAFASVEGSEIVVYAAKPDGRSAAGYGVTSANMVRLTGPPTGRRYWSLQMRHSSHARTAARISH